MYESDFFFLWNATPSVICLKKLILVSFQVTFLFFDLSHLYISHLKIYSSIFDHLLIFKSGRLKILSEALRFSNFRLYFVVIQQSHVGRRLHLSVSLGFPEWAGRFILRRISHLLPGGCKLDFWGAFLRTPVSLPCPALCSAWHPAVQEPPQNKSVVFCHPRSRPIPHSLPRGCKAIRMREKIRNSKCFFGNLCNSAQNEKNYTPNSCF